MCFYHPQTLTLISSLRTLAQSCLHPSIVCFPSFPWQVLCLSTSAVCLLTFILAILKDNKSFTINEWWNNVLAFILAGILSNKKWFSINDKCNLFDKITRFQNCQFLCLSTSAVCLFAFILAGAEQINEFLWLPDPSHFILVRFPSHDQLSILHIHRAKPIGCLI